MWESSGRAVDNEEISRNTLRQKKRQAREGLPLIPKQNERSGSGYSSFATITLMLAVTS